MDRIDPQSNKGMPPAEKTADEARDPDRRNVHSDKERWWDRTFRIGRHPHGDTEEVGEGKSNPPSVDPIFLKLVDHIGSRSQPGEPDRITPAGYSQVVAEDIRREQQEKE